MNSFDRFVTSSNFFLIFIYATALGIFSLGQVDGQRLSQILIGICLVLLVYKMFTISKRKRRRASKVIASMIFFSCLIVYSNGVSKANQAVSQVFSERNPDIADKTQFIMSRVKQIPQHKEMLTQQMDGVKYFYTKENQKQLDEIQAILKEKKQIWDKLLGETDVKLAVQLTNDPYIVNETGETDGQRAAFQSSNVTIYINGGDTELEYVLHHEYVHYRIHAANPDKEGEESRVPQWFNEGLADSAAVSIHQGYERLPWIEEVVSYRKLDHNEQFHQIRRQGVDTYLQSYVMVRKLINDYSWEQVVELIHVKNKGEFYRKLEDMTGKPFGQLEEEVEKIKNRP